MPRYCIPAMMKDCEYMIHRNMNKNKTETNRDILDEEIEECLDVTSPAMMEG